MEELCRYFLSGFAVHPQLYMGVYTIPIEELQTIAWGKSPHKMTWISGGLDVEEARQHVETATCLCTLRGAQPTSQALLRASSLAGLQAMIVNTGNRELLGQFLSCYYSVPNFPWEMFGDYQTLAASVSRMGGGKHQV